MVNTEITNITGTLGWTVESVTNVDKEYFTCPYDPSHRLTEASLNDHFISCQWKAEGYGKQDVPLSEPILSADSPFCIKFDKHLQAEILRKAKEKNPAMQIGMGERFVPRTSDRVIIDFTSDERRALYDYVVANTMKPDVGDDITNINNLELQQKEEKEMSFLELLIKERNLKRRRAKHRGVHTNKKSHTEIIREVINQQMEIYTEYISGQSGSGCITDIQDTKTDNANYEEMQDRAEQLYKVFHTSRSNDYNSEDRNDHHYKKKRDNQKRDYLEEKSYYRSKDRDRHEKYSDETNRKHRHEHRKSSRSKERKSHKKDKHRSKDKHKDKYYEKKHKSRDKSSERHYSKHSDYKRKGKNKEY
ncbi:hypothetical protein PUN28_014955 [Cardiocondyla obscurior]|uniref:CHHC U11-48K-type domain-containing protein n=2 Tax=Cardiocondyla obscurior TaxID=286306 RepID=A0AAW2F0P8_9HYME